MKINCLKSFLLFFLFSLFFPYSTRAQELSLEISPPLVEITARPETALTQTYQLKNSSAQDILLTTFLKPFQTSSKPGLPDYNLNLNENEISTPTFSLANTDFELEKPFVLPANSSQQIVLKIKTPPQNLSTDYYYTLFFAQVTSPQKQPAVAGQIGTHLLLTVSSDLALAHRPQTLSFAVHPKIVDLFLNRVRFEAVIKNQGENLLKPYGQIIVNRIWPSENKNQNEFELVLRPDNILKNSSRPVSCLYENNPSLSVCQITSYLPPGKYTAVLSYCPDSVSSSSQNCQHTTISFYVLPYLIFLLLFPVLFYYLLRKKYIT